MGGTLSCLPCVSAPGAAEKEEALEDFRGGEAPQFTKGTQDSPTRTARTAPSPASKKRRRVGGGEISSTPASSRPKPSEPDTTTTHVPLRPRRMGIGSSLHDVLRDKQITTLAILTSTIVGCVVAVTTMSGFLGSVAYLLLLSIQFTCAALARSVAGNREEEGTPKSVLAGAELAPPATAAATTSSSKDAAVDPAPSSAPKPEPAASKSTEPTALEPRTRHEYPLSIGEEVLCGLGVRQKNVIVATLDIYSCGLYACPSQLGSSGLAKKHEGGPSEGLFADLVRSTTTVGRTIRMVIQFSGLTPKLFLSAFDERLERPMKEKGASEVYEELRKGLGSIALTPGRVILLKMTTDGRLLATSGDEVLADCRSHVLCSAVTDIYLGKATPTPTLKQDCSKRIMPVLQRAAAATSQFEGPRDETEAGPADSSASAKGLSGTWEVDSAENVEEFLVALGISFMVRKIAVYLYTKDAKVIDQQGTAVSFTDFRNRRLGQPVRFEEGEVVRRKDKQGRDLEDVAAWEGEDLVVITKGYDDVIRSRYRREGGETMVSETSVKGVTMRRKWKLVSGEDGE